MAHGQQNCSCCDGLLRGNGVFCGVCGWIHIKCSGLPSGRHYWEGFVCPACISQPTESTSKSLTQGFSDLAIVVTEVPVVSRTLSSDSFPTLTVSNLGHNHRELSTHISSQDVGLSCPVHSCTEVIANTMVIQHLERHVQGIFLGEVPSIWLRDNGKYVYACGKLLAERSRLSHQNRCSDFSMASAQVGTLELPSMQEVFSLNRPTLKHVPAIARQIWSRVLQEAISQATRHPTVENYIYLALLPKCVLPSAKRAGNHNQRVDITKLCNRWTAGNRLELWHEACQAASSRVRPRTSTKTSLAEQAKKARQAAIAFAEDGLYGKASRVLCSKGLAPNTEETKRLLTEKHPAQEPPVVPHSTSPALQLPSDFKLLDTLRSFPKGTACGPSGLRVEHLLEATEATLPVSFTTTLQHFINFLIAGHAPLDIAPYMAGASLIALRKTDVDSPLDIRPIAVGEIFRRLAGKCVCALSSSKASTLFSPHQFGVACPRGVEEIVHKMRTIVADHWHDDDFVILKVDMKNAFNAVSRQAVLDECAQHFPEILPWVTWCYQSHPRLWHTMAMFLSEAGVQQGDPLGPLLFALALHRLVLELNTTDGLLHNNWYLDDGILCGTSRAIKSCLDTIISSASWSGLEINLRKCELFSRQDLSGFPADIKKSNKPNMEVLGAPIGDDGYCRQFVREKSAVAEKLLEQISSLHDPQIALNLLRQCGGFCKMVHVARCCPPEPILDPLKAFDKSVMGCLEDCAAVQLTDRARRQATLSLSSGGMGLRSLEAHAPAAYIASLTSSSQTPPTRIFAKSVDVYNERVSEDDALANDSLLHLCKSQAHLSAAIERKDQAEILAGCTNTCDRARWLAVSAPNASDWLSAVPSPGLGFRLEPAEVQSLVKLRLGLPLTSDGSHCPYCPDKSLDPFGHHALTCKRGPDVISRHNIMRDTIYDICRRAALNPVLEQGAGIDVDGTLTRPADILIPTWTLGKSGAFDITVVHPLNNSHITGASTSAFHCLGIAQDRKHQENDTKCSELNWMCIPVAVTPYGTWGSEGKAALKRVIKSFAIRANQTSSVSQKNAFIRLAVTLGRCTARAILSRTTI